ncbi:hypothetical protein BCR36DRAFT_321255 [Piromyces finnis]|uniref:Uncharacterized protein n=1 Tax=Piromyces finnis TaxID=1754191 RepID=A0A1Y1VGV2_9FUNG|nr:hypothetical protein BCR36DRAFT_321255 [Piromyces finnis]|eukprot:ORX55303.1 hypothetical protein BCR36DRAFT_321255 [Piromyces finnis]
MPIKIITKLNEDIKNNKENILKFSENNILLNISPNFQCLELLNNKENGALFVTTEEVIYWYEEIQKGISIDYNTISIHAKINDKKCIYMQLNNDKSTIFNENNDVLPMDIINPEKDNNEDDDMDDDDYVIELNFMFENDIKSTLAYEQITQCSELHPDPDDSMDESEMFDINYFNQMDAESEFPEHEPPEPEEKGDIKRQKI